MCLLENDVFIPTTCRSTQFSDKPSFMIESSDDLNINLETLREFKR